MDNVLNITNKDVWAYDCDKLRETRRRGFFASIKHYAETERLKKESDLAVS